MSYDLDLVSGWMPPTPSIGPSDPSDLEAIVTLLELAAIYLTRGPDSTFTEEELLEQARELGGAEIQLQKVDLKIVMGKSGFLKKVAGGRYRLK